MVKIGATADEDRPANSKSPECRFTDVERGIARPVDTRQNRWGMNAFVANTDRDWFDFLAARDDVDEVNFWQPSPSGRFRALSPGELFLFKLHYPQHFIVGGGFFAHYSVLPASLAWETFAEKNGATSLTQMRQRIERYRRAADPSEDYQIGCIILEEPFFFEQDLWIKPPASFARNIVRGKTYDLSSIEGRRLWHEVEVRLMSSRAEHWQEMTAIGALAMVRRRLGQGAFRVLVTDTYQRRCAVTGERVLPVLEAAHIKPVTQGGAHRIDNGLLLRSDMHRLFDRGYLTVRPNRRIEVSSRLKTDFANGEYYRKFAGAEIWTPSQPEDRPSPEFLEWHGDTVFRAS
jgi:putative restriction endonuclease